MGADRVTCGKCNRKCEGQVLSVGETYFHNYCFTCQECGSELGEDAFYNKDGVFYCAKDYLDLFGEHCFKCNQFLEGEVISALGNTFHLDCFTCGHCKKFFPPGENVIFDGQDYVCEECDASAGDPSQQPLHKCAGCREDIKTGQALMALDQHWHPRCFKCRKCGIVLQGEYMGKDGYAFCEKDYQAEFGVICASCSGYITGKVLQAGDKHYHPHCSRCAKCGQMFGEGEEMYLQGSEIWHPQCSEMVREMERVERERTEAERREMEEREEERREMERRETERRDGDRREQEKVEAERREGEQRESDRKDRELHVEAERKEAERREMEQRDIERRDMERRDLERRDLERREAEKREMEHREAERREAERREAEQREGDRREADRREAERREADRRDSERRDAERRDAERKDAERRDTERRDAERQDAERRDAEQRDAKQRDVDRKNQEEGYNRAKVGARVDVNIDGPVTNHTDLPPPNFSPPGRQSPQFDDLPPPPRPEEMPKGPPAPPTRITSRGQDWKARYGSLPRSNSGSFENGETRNAPTRPRPYSYHEPSYNDYEESTENSTAAQEQKFKTSVQLKIAKSADDITIGRSKSTGSSSSITSPIKDHKILPYKELKVDNYRMPRGVDKANLEAVDLCVKWLWEHLISCVGSLDDNIPNIPMFLSFEAVEGAKHLGKEEFREVFKMTLEEFYELPKWKQHDQKKKAKLF